MKLIKEKFPTCKWRFSYYSESDIVNIKKAIEFLKIEDGKYEFFEFKNPESYKIETRLLEENKVITYPKVS